ncbi:MAG: hypothetical protein ACKOWF_01760 [Chloroflexota bacterium]
MQRIAALVLTVTLVFGVQVGTMQVSPAGASGPSTENSRSMRFMQRFDGGVSRIYATVTTNAPIACNSRMIWSIPQGSPATIAVIANCRIVAGHRDAQKVMMTGIISTTIPSAPSQRDLRCRDVGYSNPRTGKVKLRCEFQEDSPA